MDTEMTMPTEVQAQANAAQQILEVANAYVIDCPEMLEAAGDELKSIKAKAKELETTRKAMTKPLDDSKKKIMDFFRQPQEYLKNAEATIKRAMLAYTEEQEAARRKAEAEAREKARKEQEKLRKRAEAAAAKGQTEKAEALETQADTVVTPIVPKAQTQQPAGVSMREVWSAEVTDARALLQAVLDGKVPDVAISINMKVLNQQAKSLKNSLNWPGVKAVCQKTVAAKAG